MKLTKKEIIEVTKACQEIYDRNMALSSDFFDKSKSAYLSVAIFKLQHQLKHLEDLEIKK